MSQTKNAEGAGTREKGASKKQKKTKIHFYVEDGCSPSFLGLAYGEPLSALSAPSIPPPPTLLFVVLLFTLLLPLDAFGQGSHSSSPSYTSSVEQISPPELPPEVAAAWDTHMPSLPVGGAAVEAAAG